VRVPHRTGSALGVGAPTARRVHGRNSGRRGAHDHRGVLSVATQEIRGLGIRGVTRFSSSRTTGRDPKLASWSAALLERFEPPGECRAAGRAAAYSTPERANSRRPSAAAMTDPGSHCGATKPQRTRATALRPRPIRPKRDLVVALSTTRHGSLWGQRSMRFLIGTDGTVTSRQSPDRKGGCPHVRGRDGGEVVAVPPHRRMQGDDSQLVRTDRHRAEKADASGGPLGPRREARCLRPSALGHDAACGDVSRVAQDGDGALEESLGIGPRLA
jgi:hypothetical protein